MDLPGVAETAIATPHRPPATHQSAMFPMPPNPADRAAALNLSAAETHATHAT
jgi:hypothetical protein